MGIGNSCQDSLHKKLILIGGFNPSEKYESQLGLFFPVYGKNKNVPNHQPVIFGDFGKHKTENSSR